MSIKKRLIYGERVKEEVGINEISSCNIKSKQGSAIGSAEDHISKHLCSTVTEGGKKANTFLMQAHVEISPTVYSRA